MPYLLGEHLEAVPQGSMGTFPVWMLGDPTPNGKLAGLELAFLKLPEAPRSTHSSPCYTAITGPASRLCGPCLSSWGVTGEGHKWQDGRARKGRGRHDLQKTGKCKGTQLGGPWGPVMSPVVPQISNFPSLGLFPPLSHEQIHLIFSPVPSITKVLPRVLGEEKKMQWASCAQSKEGTTL